MRMLVPVLILCSFPISGRTDDFASLRDKNWHQWRGPLASGVAPFGDPPVTWDKTSHIRWKVEIPGAGTASPIVWGDHVFVLTAVETARTLDPPPKFPEPPPGSPQTTPPSPTISSS